MSDDQKIVTALWFDANAEEAVDFYCSVFADSRIVDVMHYTDAGPGVAGSVVAITYELTGQRFIAINGGPVFTHSPAMSLFVPCETQAEVDRLWHALLAGGGSPMQCGWLTDRFGVSWQIVPTALGEMLRDADPARAKRVAEAMFGMVRLDIAGLHRAHDGPQE